MTSPLTALSAIDGRYARTGRKLVPYFSEHALITYRVKMQVEYLFFARKLPVSRLQRDLTDSTVKRNFGLALGHCLHAYHPEILAEAYQTILRRASYPDAYDLLKGATRGKEVTLADLQAQIQELKIPEVVRQELLALTPEKYIGLAVKLARP